jgi:hypothetical protein
MQQNNQNQSNNNPTPKPIPLTSEQLVEREPVVYGLGVFDIPCVDLSLKKTWDRPNDVYNFEI